MNNESLFTNHASRDTLHASRTIIQNKPNFLDAQMNISYYITEDYENQGRLRTPPKQTQFIPTEGGSNPISKAKEFPKNPQFPPNHDNFNRQFFPAAAAAVPLADPLRLLNCHLFFQQTHRCFPG
jgi:hypothetical protein